MAKIYLLIFIAMAIKISAWFYCMLQERFLQIQSKICIIPLILTCGDVACLPAVPADSARADLAGRQNHFLWGGSSSVVEHRSPKPMTKVRFLPPLPSCNDRAQSSVFAWVHRRFIQF